MHPELAAESRLLETAERRRGTNRAVGVDREHAGLESARDTQGSRTVLRPDRAGETVGRVVGDLDRLFLVRKGNQSGDRTEDLLTGNAVLILGSLVSVAVIMISPGVRFAGDSQEKCYCGREGNCGLVDRTKFAETRGNPA